ncbi:MAG: hypothetical protein KAH34_05735 [Ketobacter sp.]|nr:hypothetical protein [Ketobacter sp.]
METNDNTKTNVTRQYDSLAHKFSEIYSAGKERGRESMSVALEKARAQLTSLGEFSVEQGEELKQYLARDLDQTMLDFEQLGDRAKDRFNPSRLGAGALSSLASVLQSGETTLHSLSSKAEESITYKTGEVTSAGTLTCQACLQKIHLKATGHVPPCPKCSSTVFHKGY